VKETWNSILVQIISCVVVISGIFCTRQSSGDDDIRRQFIWRSREIPEEIDRWLIPFVDVGKFIVKCTRFHNLSCARIKTCLNCDGSKIT
jgi:hypothetical protein